MTPTPDGPAPHGGDAPQPNADPDLLDAIRSIEATGEDSYASRSGEDEDEETRGPAEGTGESAGTD